MPTRRALVALFVVPLMMLPAAAALRAEAPPLPVLPLPETGPLALPVFDDVESGAVNWTATGQWHVTEDRSSSGTHSWYYGQEIGPGVEDNTYDTGLANSGTLTSPALDLPAGESIVLSFWSHWAGEGGAYERPLVQVSQDGVSWATVYDEPVSSGVGTMIVDLSIYAGTVVQIRFVWDTLDNVANAFEGWYVDDVSVTTTASPSACPQTVDVYGNTCSVVATDYVAPGAGATNLGLGDDYVVELPLPFLFRFYGRAYANVSVASNGFIAFQDPMTNGCCSGGAIPDPAVPNNIVAGYWTDHYPPGHGNVTVETLGAPGSRVFVVSWNEVAACCSADGPNSTFQIKLFEGVDVVEVHVVSAAGSGRTVTSGIENCDGTDGILYVRDAVDLLNTSYRITPPTSTVECGAAPPPQVPSTLISSPAWGSTVSGVVAVTGWSSDGADWVDLHVDGAYLQTLVPEPSGDWTYDLDTSLFADGLHVVSAVAGNEHGTGYSTSVEVSFLNAAGGSPPTVSIAAPIAGARVGGIVLVEGAAADPDGAVERVEVRIGTGPWKRASGAESWAIHLDTTNAPNGPQTVEARSFDGGFWSEVASVEVDVQNNRAPVVYLNYPWSGMTVSGILWMDGGAYDMDYADAIELVEVRVDGGAWRPASGTDSWTRLLDTTTLADGLHDIEVRAFDGELYSRVALAQVIVQNAQAPVALVESPRDGRTVSGEFVVSGVAYGDSAAVRRVEVSFDGYDWRVAEGTDAWSLRVDSTELGDGWHYVMARAYDGNQYSSWYDSAWFSVLNLPDLAVESVVVERQPFQTSFGSVPNDVAETRLVTVVVRNVGTLPADGSSILVTAEAKVSGVPGLLPTLHSRELIADATVGALQPGESVVLELEWDVRENVGDHVVVANVDYDGQVEEFREDNNARSVRTFVRAGGLGGYAGPW